MPKELTQAGSAGAPPPAPPLTGDLLGGPGGLGDGPPGAGRRARAFAGRALAWSLLVLAVGAAFGAAGFWYEQSLATWRPEVAREGATVRITTPQRLPAHALALGGDNLAWTEGPFTVTLDLRAGGAKLLGAARSAALLGGLSASESHVVWSVVGGAAPAVWAYSAAERRRERLPGTGGVRDAPSVSGGRAAWVESASGGEQLVLADLADGGGRTVVASGPSLTWPVLAGDLVAWLATRPGQPPLVEVRDLATGQAWSIAPYAEGRTTLYGIALAGRTLVWSRRQETTGGQVLTYDLETRAVRVLAAAPDVSSPAADGDLVAWAEIPSGGTAPRSLVRALRLGSTQAVQLADVVGEVAWVAVGGAHVAWIELRAGASSVIRTAEAPR